MTTPYSRCIETALHLFSKFKARPTAALLCTAIGPGLTAAGLRSPGVTPEQKKYNDGLAGLTLAVVGLTFLYFCVYWILRRGIQGNSHLV